MTNYLENGVRAMEKSLRDVVLPALKTDDPLAREQLNLVIDYLGFLRTRLDYIQHQCRFEHELYRDMARRIIDIAGDTLLTRNLADAVASSETLRTNVWASATDIRTAFSTIAQGIDELVAMAARSGNETLRSSIDHEVREATAYWIDLEQSWYAPIAVDPDAPGLKPLDSFFPYRSQRQEIER